MILIPTHRIIDRASLRARARSRARLPKNFKTFIPPLRPQYDHRAAPDTRSHISVGRRARGQTAAGALISIVSRARVRRHTRAPARPRRLARASRADRRAIALSARARRPGAPTRALSRARAFN
jgi:hypothetical protein